MQDVKRAETITLDQLVSTGVRSALSTIRDLQTDKKVEYLPAIWVGYRIEPVFKDFELPGLPGQQKG